MLIEFDIALADALCIGIGDLWHGLAGLVHEVMFDEPLAYKLLRQLLLGLSLLKFLFVAVSIEVTLGVGGVDLVDEIYLSIALSKFVFGIYEDEALLGGNLLSACKEATGVVFHHSIVFC